MYTLLATLAASTPIEKLVETMNLRPFHLAPTNEWDVLCWIGVAIGAVVFVIDAVRASPLVLVSGVGTITAAFMATH